MFGLILNRIINFWPFDKNESLYLASLKLDYKQTVPDQRDSKEGILIRGSCSALYQNFRLHWIMSLLSFAGLLSDRSTSISQITMVFQLLVIILEDRKIISAIY